MELKFYDKVVTNNTDVAEGNPISRVRANINGAELNAHLQTGYMYGACVLTGLKAGTNAFERIGRKVTVKSLQLHGKVSCNSTKEEHDQIPFSFWVILDTQANGQYPTTADFFVADSGGGATTPAGNSYQLPTNLMGNIANQQRYRVLARKDWVAVPQIIWTEMGNLTSQTVTKNLGIYLPNLNLVIEYGSTEGAIGEIKSNNLILCWTCNKKFANTTENYYDVDIKSRIRYTDA